MTASAEILDSLRTSVDYDSPIPYYVQIKEALREHIERGDWRPGDQLPGEPELCRIFGVSRTVIRQALKDMEYRGLIVRRKGKGTFVAEPKILEGLVQKLTGFYQDMVERGYTPVSQVLKREVIPANPKVAAYLGLEPDVPVIVIERLRFIEDEPIVLVTTYLPYELCPEILHEDLSGQSLYACLEKRYGLTIARGRRTIEAVPANEYEAQLLQVEKGTPLVLLDSVSYLEDGTPVEYYHALHRGDRSRFEVELVRIREQGGVREVLGGEGVDLPPSNDLA
ncbi:MAG: GntR family transcriptional regulator [Anaerolineae bacterium]|nr:GntR family transcriptional regulator [Anaerolineae bacterium]